MGVFFGSRVCRKFPFTNFKLPIKFTLRSIAITRLNQERGICLGEKAFTKMRENFIQLQTSFLIKTSINHFGERTKKEKKENYRWFSRHFLLATAFFRNRREKILFINVKQNFENYWTHRSKIFSPDGIFSFTFFLQRSRKKCEVTDFIAATED